MPFASFPPEITKFLSTCTVDETVSVPPENYEDRYTLVGLALVQKVIKGDVWPVEIKVAVLPTSCGPYFDAGAAGIVAGTFKPGVKGEPILQLAKRPFGDALRDDGLHGLEDASHVRKQRGVEPTPARHSLAQHHGRQPGSPQVELVRSTGPALWTWGMVRVIVGVSRMQGCWARAAESRSPLPSSCPLVGKQRRRSEGYRDLEEAERS